MGGSSGLRSESSFLYELREGSHINIPFVPQLTGEKVPEACETKTSLLMTKVEEQCVHTRTHHKYQSLFQTVHFSIDFPDP